MGTQTRIAQTILDKIETAGFDVFRRRPHLSAADTAKIIARAATQRWPSFASPQGR